LKKSPRKIASQKRSRATVDMLVEATARILVKEGYDRASTNRIAAAAGVSIGSLYQYFPSKEALVAAVIERHAQQLSQVGRDAFLRAATRPVEIVVRELVAAGIDAHRVDPKLHRVLDEEVPRVARRPDTDAVVRDACALFRVYLEAHRSEIDVADLDLASFILITTVEALTHAAVLHRRDILADEKKAVEFTDEVARLALRYLRTPSPLRQRMRARGTRCGVGGAPRLSEGTATPSPRAQDREHFGESQALNNRHFLARRPNSWFSFSEAPGADGHLPELCCRVNWSGRGSWTYLVKSG
jgi:AcrR family transcriptional regulator